MAKREPNILIVTGDDGFHRRRLVKDIVAAKIADGWRADQADGEVPAQLDAALGSGGMFLQETVRTLIVVENPEKIPPEVYKEHFEDKGAPAVLLLHYDGNPKGNTKFGKYVVTQKKNHRECKQPAKWDIPAACATFCVEEAKRYGLTLDAVLAEKIVELAGADLGVLSFEIRKLAMFADADGAKTITMQSVPQSLAVILEAQMQPVIEAISARDPKRLSRTLNRLHKTTKQDMTIPLCRVLGPTTLRWYSAVDLRDSGKDAGEGALLLGMNTWYYKNKYLPQMNGWARRDLLGLIRALAVSERKALSGVVNPWVGLVGRLLSACLGE